MGSFFFCQLLRPVADVEYILQEVQKCLEHISQRSASAQKSTGSAKECPQRTAARFLPAAAQKAEQGSPTNSHAV